MSKELTEEEFMAAQEELLNEQARSEVADDFYPDAAENKPVLDAAARLKRAKVNHDLLMSEHTKLGELIRINEDRLKLADQEVQDAVHGLTLAALV